HDCIRNFARLACPLANSLWNEAPLLAIVALIVVVATAVHSYYDQTLYLLATRSEKRLRRRIAMLENYQNQINSPHYVSEMAYPGAAPSASPVPGFPPRSLTA